LIAEFRSSNPIGNDVGMTVRSDRRLAGRSWVPRYTEEVIDAVAGDLGSSAAFDLLEGLVEANRVIHHQDCVNLNPASNTMSPRARSMLASELGPRTSLGYAGGKYEMGLEAIERIEIIAAEVAARVFDVDYVEFRVPSGAMANLYGFMVAAAPGDSVIVPPPTIAGHVTHHAAGAAGLYGLDIHHAPIDSARYTVDTDALADLAQRVRPRLITIGGSLNLTHHDVPAIRAIADEHDAIVLFDAAHLSGPIAGGRWPNPIAQGAHLMTMSTYKSLAGPTAGLVLTNDPAIAERLEQIAFPGLTANFDVGKTAALAVTLNEWLIDGPAHASAMLDTASRLADELAGLGVPVHRCGEVATMSHAFAIDARGVGGGAAGAHMLRQSNLLVSAIGLPSGTDDGVRVGANELARIGASPGDMVELASLFASAWRGADPTSIAPQVADFRARYSGVRFTGS
jgi:glycine hydroxymethyltransferase